MESGIDLTSILRGDTDEEEDSDGTDIEKMTKLNEEVPMDKSTRGSSISKSKRNDLAQIQNDSKEEIGLLKELEASSKKKVKGSLLLHYFNSAKRPYTLVFIIASFLLAQALASIADVWVSYW